MAIAPDIGRSRSAPAGSVGCVMNINTAYLSSLLGSSASTGSGSQATQATGAMAAASAALSKAATRIQADATATTAQLSSFGQLKSALASSQTAAQALTQLSSASSAADVTQATGDFFNAFNAAVKAAAAVPGSEQAAQAAGRVGRDLDGALTGGVANQNAMSKLGLSVQTDGTLKQDASKFAAALAKDPAGVAAALAQLGKQVQAAANKELASDGNVGNSVAKLTLHSSALTQQQKAMLTLQQSTGLSVYQRASGQ